MNEFQNRIFKIIQEINDRLNTITGEENLGFNIFLIFESNGEDCLIKFMGNTIWQSWEDYSDAFDREEENIEKENADFEAYLLGEMKDIISFIDKLRGKI